MLSVEGDPPGLGSILKIQRLENYVLACRATRLSFEIKGAVKGGCARKNFRKDAKTWALVLAAGLVTA